MRRLHEECLRRALRRLLISTCCCAQSFLALIMALVPGCKSALHNLVQAPMTCVYKYVQTLTYSIDGVFLV